MKSPASTVILVVIQTAKTEGCTCDNAAPQPKLKYVHLLILQNRYIQVDAFTRVTRVCTTIPSPLS